MAKPVYASEGRLHTDDGQFLVGAGQELGFAERTTNFVTASTSFVDVTGLSFTITVPSGPFNIVAQAPVIVEESGAVASLRLMADSTQVFNGDLRATAVNDSKSIQLFARIPCSFHAPAAGTQVTYKVQAKTSVATSDCTLLVDFAGTRGLTFIQAYTLR